MNIIFCGTPDFAVPALKAIYEAGHNIPLVVTMPDKPKGRKGEPAPSPVKVQAMEYGIPVYQPLTLKTDEVYEELAKYQPDVMVVTAYGKIIPKRILDLPKYGCINEHASLLPAYRGAAPIQWAVLDGLEKTGVTIMYMGEGLDTGDMISVVETPIAEDETSESLFDKLAEDGAKLLVETLVSIENGTATRTPQPEESTTPYARMITKADGKIDFNRNTKELECFVRGMNSWPCAYTSVNGKNLKIWKAAIAVVMGENSCVTSEFCPGHEGACGKMPGTVLKADKDGLVVKTKDGALKILELQIEGKKRMDYETFLRGYKLEVGTVLGE